MNKRGLFITFEGPDGSGKSTQIRRIAEFLKNHNLPFLLTREPGGTTVGDQIRAMVLNPENRMIVDQTEILLYAASRSQHVQEKIRPALEKGWIVLCDRFTDASIAYQGYGLGQDVAMVQMINRFATDGLEPDQTFLIDVSPETGRKRMESREGAAEVGITQNAAELDRIEARALAYHQRVREGFLALYHENKQRITLIDGEKDREEVYSTIIKALRGSLNLK
ncbi:dTMP kinase [Sporolactobacillus spathodeae]|uniref:Thymidylate kinase n=1 Tax=Sporolactobacillus spathodeae TaxID=1465502 RepID=A0ABS2QAI6_9BACL|nr:dTMP kinase [Sporolactobacillus spathodeae]MBM7658802.1 dTMP kinase [Sporolactobacillus spathodeae]